jgi:hypothetical protein
MDGEPPPPEERAVRERVLPGGMVKLEMVLSPDEAPLVLQAIEKARATLRDASAEAPRDATPAPRRADAPNSGPTPLRR